MATKATTKTLAELLNPGASKAPAPINFNVANSTPATLVNNTPLPAFPTATKPSLSSMLAPAPAPTPRVATAPINAPTLSPIQPVAPVISSTQGNPSAPPVGPTGATGAAPANQTPVNPQWLNADGSFKTPDQIASEIGGALKSAHGTGDVGTLAGEQFLGGNGTTANAEAEARRITNTRNDIAVGETDPYGVGASSGIAYTPAELSAIEKAYAGIYDPALDTALAKVTSKQAADKQAADAAANLEQIKAQGDQTRQTQAEAPYTLGANDVRYGTDGKPIAVGSGAGSSPTTYVPGADATADAYVKGFQSGIYKASDIPDAYKGIVAQGVAATKPVQSKNTTDALSNITSLLNDPNAIPAITGYSSVNPLSFLPSASEAPYRNLLNQLAGTLALQNRQQLKGSGAISDFEFRVLQQAASDLGVQPNGTSNLSETALKAGLQKLQLKLQVGPTNLTDDELQFLNSKGYSPDDIRAYDSSQSFSDVGNTTASTGQNRPQRNNNPGNVKSGGLADSLATGTDDQGHLVFPNADAGFKALALDLTAKLNGGSKYLPANPTIAQLGSVYAEDPNWPKKVAMMLGVGVNTSTTSVPFDKLVKAVATQEGFYA